jgi:hypothetical protein
LKYLDKIDDLSRISRISPGVGYSDNAAPSSTIGSNDVYFESDFDFVTLNYSLKFLNLNYSFKKIIILNLVLGIRI